MATTKYIHQLEEFPVPRSYALENKVLGILIGDSTYLDEARERLNDMSFEDIENRALWKIVQSMDMTGDPISMETVYPKCNTQHFQEYIAPYLAIATPVEARNAIISLYELTLKRKAYIAGMTMIQASQREDGVSSAFETASNYIKAVEEDINTDTTRNVKQAINEFAEVVSDREKARIEGKMVRIPTSFPSLDRITYNGWTAGQLIILAARPSIGKTAVMLQFARMAALKGAASVVFSLEMTNNELVQRMLTSTQEVNGYDLANGIVDWSKFEQASGKFSDLPLWFNDQCFTLDSLIIKIKSMAKKGNCDIAFIDYLGLISFPNDNRTIYAQVTEATKRLKRLSKEAGVPIVLLCQLNRDMSKDGRAPELFDLRDSGSIEQDADIVMMLDRSLDPDKDYHDLTMFVRKNRQGQLVNINIKADNCLTNFTEV